MQTDMHFYGTYCLARAAGIDPDSCNIIATASQLVDDHTEKDTMEFKDGARVDTEATGHHSTQGQNLLEEDQRMVWVPFHFLPGNAGDTYQERMVCQKDSEIAKEMVEHNLSLHDRPYALPLLGITAHVYADTFSHHGFSGYSSPLNKVDIDSFKFSAEMSKDIISYVTGKISRFIEKFQSEIAEDVSQLGHGGVYTYPDRPFLKWSFIYENGSGERVERDNPQDFLDGCKALHAMFARFAELSSEYRADAGKSFEEIEPTVIDVIHHQAGKQGRIDAWKAAASSGRLFAGGPEAMPNYDESLCEQQRNALARADDSRVAAGEPIYQFYQAAATHRTHVLRDLLPSYGLVAH